MYDTAEKVLGSGPAQEAFASRLTFELPNGMQISPNYVQAFLVIFIIFLIILVVARLRKRYVSESLKGAGSLIALGFVLAIVLEALMIIGGRTIFTELIGWENAPKPVATALDAGRGKLVDVLGTSDASIPESLAKENNSSSQVIQLIKELPADQREEVFDNFCSP